MNIWESFFQKLRRHKEPEVKKVVRFQGLIIKLYKTNWTSSEIVCNIKAYDIEGKPLWTVQAPTHSRHYWDMQVDEETGQLDADSGSGTHYIISLADGRILSSRLIK